MRLKKLNVVKKFVLCYTSTNIESRFFQQIEEKGKMKKIFRKVQFLSNIATIVIALLFSLVVGKLYLFPSSELTNNVASPRTVTSIPQPTPKAITQSAQISPIGKSVPLENVNWKENKKTLVLYVSTTCHFCTESSPFYKRLAEKYSDSKDVKLVTIMPQPIDDAKAYLKDLEINIKEVYSYPLTSIGVTATPTLLLVNDSGIVTEIWRGKLSSDREDQVLSKLSS